ncbi:MAG: hypothetical protein KIS78_13560 [Labilithrix sp.]|nr:hypothetical protein [Labilithrix sp.]
MLAGALLATPDVRAADESIAVGEVTPPPAGSGIDVSLLRDVAAAEIRQIDASRLRDRRKVVVSFALTGAVAERTIACTVNAMVRDARTGVMIGIIEAGAHADGPVSAELRRQVARAAVRNAVQRIPRVLGVR